MPLLTCPSMDKVSSPNVIDVVVKADTAQLQSCHYCCMVLICVHQFLKPLKHTLSDNLSVVSFWLSD